MSVQVRNLLAKVGTPLLDAVPETAVYACAMLGAWQLVKVAGDVSYGVWKHMIRPRRNLRSRYAGANAPYAVVTGGADGLGRAYALELAKEGFHLCVIDKDQAKLKELEGLLPSGTDLISIVYDMAKLGSEDGLAVLTAQLDDKLVGKDVAVLVNNVAEFQHEDLVTASWSYVLRATHVNSHSYAALARHFVPKLLARAQNGVRSAVINVGTCAAEPQNPRYRFSIYGATKAYTHILSSSLREMYSDKIDVMTVIPRQCETAMNPAGYMFTLQPATHAKAVMNQLGYEAVTYGPFTHCLEYQMRYRYTLGLGLFDKWVQRMNRARNENLVKLYDARK